MESTIYYFTGTGNSLVLAKNLARILGAQLVSMVSLGSELEVRPKEDVVGLVFPVYFVYFADLPLIVSRFARKLVGIEQAYIFAVANYGGAAGETYQKLGSIIEERGGHLNSWFGLHMPQNSFRKPWENPISITRKAESRLVVISEIIRNRRNGTAFTNHLLSWLMIRLCPTVQKLFRKQLASLSGVPENQSPERLIQGSDRSYKSLDTCTSCGQCVRVCPVDNIELRDGKPFWKGHCENCLACYNWCPVHAIQGGIVPQGYFYRHPAISVVDIMSQKGFS
jgi:ferredoxin